MGHWVCHPRILDIIIMDSFRLLVLGMGTVPSIYINKIFKYLFKTFYSGLDLETDRRF